MKECTECIKKNYKVSDLEQRVKDLADYIKKQKDKAPHD